MGIAYQVGVVEGEAGGGRAQRWAEAERSAANGCRRRSGVRCGAVCVCGSDIREERCSAVGPAARCDARPRASGADGCGARRWERYPGWARRAPARQASSSRHGGPTRAAHSMLGGRRLQRLARIGRLDRRESTRARRRLRLQSHNGRHTHVSCAVGDLERTYRTTKRAVKRWCDRAPANRCTNRTTRRRPRRHDAALAPGDAAPAPPDFRPADSALEAQSGRSPHADRPRACPYSSPSASIAFI